MQQSFLQTSFLVVFLVGNIAWAQVDERDIPPPPMPEYLKQHNKRLGINSDAMVPTPAEQQLSEGAAPKVEPSRADSSESVEMANREPQQVSQPAQVQASAQLSQPKAPQAVESVTEPAAPAPFERVSAPTPVESPDSPEKVMKPKTNVQIPKPVKQAKTQEPAVKKRKVATSVFKSGMHKFTSDCTMRAKPSAESAPKGSIGKGRKLWIDPHNEDWHKAYKKSGTVYIPANCLK